MTTRSDESEHTDLVNPLVSPSLSTGGRGMNAYEMKFALSEEQAAAVQSWAAECLQTDPYGVPQDGGQYLITSLYTDTVDRDIYHRKAAYVRRKYRLRRYGQESTIHLERKTRRGDRVSKQRTAIPDLQIERLSGNILAIESTDWPGDWFHQRLQQKQLLPACQISYRRTAFLGTSAEGPLRLTLDRQIRGQLTTMWEVGIGPDAIDLLPNTVVLELKFRTTMPILFRRLVESCHLNPTGVSKYRRCIETCELSADSAAREVRYA